MEANGAETPPLLYFYEVSRVYLFIARSLATLSQLVSHNALLKFSKATATTDYVGMHVCVCIYIHTRAVYTVHVNGLSM